jgi:hypothetical protein
LDSFCGKSLFVTENKFYLKRKKNRVDNSLGGLMEEIF